MTTHTKSAYITPEGGHQFHKSHVFALKEDKFQLFSGSADTLVKIIDLEVSPPPPRPMWRVRPDGRSGAFVATPRL